LPRNEIFRQALYSLNKHAGMQAHYGVKRMDFIPTPPTTPPPPASYFSAVCIFSLRGARDTLQQKCLPHLFKQSEKVCRQTFHGELNFWHFCATFVTTRRSRKKKVP